MSGTILGCIADGFTGATEPATVDDDEINLIFCEPIKPSFLIVVQINRSDQVGPAQAPSGTDHADYAALQASANQRGAFSVTTLVTSATRFVSTYKNSSIRASERCAGRSEVVRQNWTGC